jgi:hypothetical protein
MVKKENIKKGEKNMGLHHSDTNKKVLVNGIDYIELDSVGSTLTSDLLVFPTDCSEAPETASDAEFMSGVHIYDLDSEWFNSLSSDDLTDFFEFVESTQDLTVSLANGERGLSVVYSEWKTKLWGEWEEANNCYMNLEVI